LGLNSNLINLLGKLDIFIIFSVALKTVQLIIKCYDTSAVTFSIMTFDTTLLSITIKNSTLSIKTLSITTLRF
jgi:hypothetical protein